MLLKTTTSLETDVKTRATIAKKGRTYKYVQAIRFCNVTLDPTGREIFPDGLCTFSIIEHTGGNGSGANDITTLASTPSSEGGKSDRKKASRSTTPVKRSSSSVSTSKPRSASSGTGGSMIKGANLGASSAGNQLTKTRPQGTVHIILCDSEAEMALWITDIELAIQSNKVRKRMTTTSDEQRS